MDAEKRQEEVRSGAYRQRTETGLVLGGFALILLVGGVLSLLLLGRGPATIAVGVILLAFAALLVLFKGLDLLDKWLKRG